MTTESVQQAAMTVARQHIEPNTSQGVSTTNNGEQPVPSTSTAPTNTEVQLEKNLNAMENHTKGREDEPPTNERNETPRRYALTGRGRDPKEKIQEACKEINYKNLTVLLAVGDYIVNQVKSIKEVAKKWGLSFSAVQRAMSGKHEHSMGGRQYAQKRKSMEQPEESTKRSKRLQEKSSPQPREEKAPTPNPAEMDGGSTDDSQELPDVLWASSST